MSIAVQTSSATALTICGGHVCEVQLRKGEAAGECGSACPNASLVEQARQVDLYMPMLQPLTERVRRLATDPGEYFADVPEDGRDIGGRKSPCASYSHRGTILDPCRASGSHNVAAVTEAMRDPVEVVVRL
jgi:hypothetical protein